MQMKLVQTVADLYLDSEPKPNPVGQQRLGEYRSMLLHTAEFTEKPEPTLRLLPVYLQPASAGTGQWMGRRQAQIFFSNAGTAALLGGHL